MYHMLAFSWWINFHVFCELVYVRKIQPENIWSENEACCVFVRNSRHQPFHNFTEKIPAKISMYTVLPVLSRMYIRTHSEYMSE